MADLASIEEAKQHLNIPVAKTASDEELTYFIGVASDLVEKAANRKWRDTTVVDETHKGGRDAIVLNHSPVASVDSVVAGGSTLDPADYVLTASTGLIRLRSGAFPPGEGSVVVSYTAGCGEAEPPLLARHATLETLRHLWTTQRGTVVRNQIAGDDYSGQGTTYTLPMRVVELIDKLSLSTGIG